jgi:hypothetical protein
MPRFVLTYRGAAASPPDAEVRQIESAGKIVDRAARALLLDTDEHDTGKLAKILPDWGIEPERFYPVPDRQEKIRKSVSN